MRKSAVLVGVGIAMAALAPVPALAAFECPASSTPMVKLPETVAPPISEMASDKPLAAAVATLRDKGLAKSAIVDQLVASYCPAVAADKAIPDDRKDQEVSRFASKVATLAYVSAYNRTEDILLDVPLTPDTVSRIRDAAKRTGVSMDQWITTAIDGKLAQ